MSSSIDIRIFGVPERQEWIDRNKRILNVPEENIIMDYEHYGCAPTARRAWLKKTDKPFTMVLSDDAELCDDFISYCERIVKAHPKKIISLFPFQFIKPVPGSRLPAPSESPYVLAKTLSGLGIIMRTEWVEPCIDSWPPYAKGDDTNIQAWAERNRIKILTTLPALIQHIGDVSVCDPSRSLGRTPYFAKDPSGFDWDSKYVRSWTNIIDE